MKIEYDSIKPNPQTDTATTSYRTTGSGRAENGNAYAIDISGTVMDNSAYKGQGKAAEDVMQEAALTDVAVRRNYMTVMSNSMSEEDFARLEEEGYPVGSVDAEEIVTVVDRIKAELAEAGVEIKGYTDTLDRATLERITGSAARADAIVSALQENDLPVTEKNVEEVNKALQEANSLKAPEDAEKKYLVENEKEPTVHNLYKASHSVPGGQTRQGRGYFQEGTAGYLGKKAEQLDMEKLRPQVEKIIREAGLEVTEETFSDAQWLLEQGVPLTAGHLLQLGQLNHLPVPGTEQEYIQAIVTAMANGEGAEQANLFRQKNYREEAAIIQEVVSTAEDSDVEKAVNRCAEAGKPVTISDLKEAKKEQENPQINVSEGSQNEESCVSARRRLEEIRLHMTAEANYRLLKKGFSVDTAPLEQVIEELKKLEQETAEKLFAGQDGAVEKVLRLQEALKGAADIRSMPAKLIGPLASAGQDLTLRQIQSMGKAEKQAYRNFEQTFEAVMTSPRKDLGDSMKKAFGNVDDLLKEMGLETTEDNRRAVRILGYNRMDITEENLWKVKEADSALQKVLDKMTPKNTLELIRREINPLDTGLRDLEKQLDTLGDTIREDAEKYSRYLYKLEQNHEITEEEKEAYIGIFRLMRQIEKSDGAVIGSLVQQGADLNFKNLLSAVRTSKQRGMDVRSDAETGMRESRDSGENTITEQITNYYQRMAEEIYHKLEPERVTYMNISAETTLEQMKTAVTQNPADQEMERTFQEGRMNEIRKAQTVEDSVIRTLLDYHQPVTTENLLASQALLNERGEMYRQIRQAAVRSEEEGTQKEAEEALEDVPEALEDRDTAATAISHMKDVLGKITDISIDAGSMSARDMRALSVLYKQISFAAGMAKEENYEVPVEIGGKLTSVNLKILHGSADGGKVSVTMETEVYGKAAAEFSLTDGRISGYFVAGTEEGKASLRELESDLRSEFTEAGFLTESLHFTDSRQLDINTFGKKQPIQGHQNITAAQLYSVAKCFIKALQK